MTMQLQQIAERGELLFREKERCFRVFFDKRVKQRVRNALVRYAQGEADKIAVIVRVGIRRSICAIGAIVRFHVVVVAAAPWTWRRHR